METTSEANTDQQILQFLIEKSKDVHSPWTVAGLADDYQRAGFPLTTGLFYYRIEKVRRRIQNINSIDLETKVKLLFGLGEPLEKSLLNEIAQEPNVTIEVDDQDRIVKYEKEGGFKLQGRHRGKRSRINDKDKPMLDYLADVVKNVNGILIDANLIRDYKQWSNDARNMKSLLEKFRFIKTCIYESIEYDENTRVRMLFACGAPVNDRQLEELRTTATVELDLEKRIIRYSTHDGSLELVGDHRMKSKLKSALEERKRRTEGEMEDTEDDDQFDESRIMSERIWRKRRFDPSSSSTSYDGYEPMGAFPQSPIFVKRETEQEDGSWGTDHYRHNKPPINYAADLPNVKNNAPNLSSQRNVQDLPAIKILEFLHSIVCTLDTASLYELQLRIERSIETIEYKKVAIDDVQVILQSSFIIAKSNATEAILSNESTMFILFLSVFRCALFTLKTVCFEQLHERIRGAIKEATNQHKTISNEKIKTVIESILALVV